MAMWFYAQFMMSLHPMYRGLFIHCLNIYYPITQSRNPLGCWLPWCLLLTFFWQPNGLWIWLVQLIRAAKPGTICVTMCLWKIQK